MDRGGYKCWVLFTQKVRGMGHTPPLSFDLSMSTLLYFKDGPNGTKIIAKQADYHSFESMFYSLPLLGWALEKGFRRALSWQIIGGAETVAEAWPAIQDALHRFPALKKVWDTAAAALAHWDSLGARLTGGLGVGRRMAPYDPAL